MERFGLFEIGADRDRRDILLLLFLLFLLLERGVENRDALIKVQLAVFSIWSEGGKRSAYQCRRRLR